MLSSIRDDAKMPFLIGIVCIILVASFALYWVLKKDYQPLFSDLQPEDTAVIIDQLEKIESNYRINNSNGALEVPAQDVHSTRLKLMSSDVSLKGGVGYEVFDNSDFGMTEFAQKINYQRALEGELQRTITSLDQVKHARVHLVMPDRNLFRDDKQEPTASVTLLLKEGFNLNPEQITGVQRLVSASVPGLKESMVTISDHHGKTLTQAMPADKAVQMVPWQLQQKMNAETYLVNKINKVLGMAFDVDQVSISVDIIMNFSQVRKTEEQVIPIADGRAISKEKESRLGGQTSKKGNQNVTREVEYRMGKSVAEIVESPGRITKINIGIMLPAALQEEKRKEIKRLIEVTAGVDASRGDSVAIYAYDAVKNDALVDANSVVSDQVSFDMPSQKPVEDISIHDNFPMVNNTVNNDEYLLVQRIIEKYWLHVSAVLFVIFVFIAVLIFSRRSVRNKKRKLNSEEREKVLMQLQHWLSEAK